MIIKNYILNISYQILVILIPLITTPYLSRVIGTQGIGVYSYYYSIAYYFSIFILLGLNNYGTRKIAEAKSHRRDIGKEFFSIYTMQFLFGIIVIILYILYTLNLSSDTKISLIFLIYIISAVFDVNWLFNGLEQFKITITRSFFVKLFSTLSIFLFVKSKNDVYLYCLILSFSFLINQLCLWPFIIKKFRFYLPNIKEIKEHIKPNFVLFLSVLGTSIYKYMDKIMLGILCSKIEVGYYEQSERIIALPVAFIASLGAVMLPRMTSMLNDSRKNNNFNEYFKKSMFFSMAVSSVLSFGIMSVAFEFVPLYYGTGNQKISYLFLVLLPSCIFLGIGNVITTQYLIPRNKDSIYIKSIFIGAFINVITNLILIPKFESLGAALGTLFAEITSCIYKVIMSNKEMKTISILKKGISLIFIPISMFIVLSIIRINKSNLYILFFKIVVGALYYLVLMIIFNKKYILSKSHRRK